MRRRKTRSDKIVLTDEQFEIMEKLAGLGLTIKQICSIIGISHQTLYRRLKEDGIEKISVTLSRGRSVAISKVAAKAFDLALEGDSSMIRYILSTQAGWTEKSQITIEGGENPLVVSSISDEQIQRMAREFLAKDEENE